MTTKHPDQMVSYVNYCAKPNNKMKVLTSISDRDAGGAVVRDYDGALIALAQKQLEMGIFEKVPMIFIRTNPYLDWIKKVSGVDSPKRRKRDLEQKNHTMVIAKSTLEPVNGNSSKPEMYSVITQPSRKTLSEEKSNEIKPIMKKSSKKSKKSKRPKKSKKPKKTHKHKKSKNPKRILQDKSSNSTSHRAVRVKLTIGDRYIDAQNGDFKNVSVQFDEDDTVNVGLD